MSGRYCQHHLTGVPPNAPPFYKPGCPQCTRKLELGLVTEDTPPPKDNSREKANRLNKGCFVGGRHRRASPTTTWRE